MNPKVSVIIPTYNRANFLIQALDSVLVQTYKNLEIVVVDDGSTDDTKRRITPYVEKYGVKYIYQENQGLPSARNTGIFNSSGTYISVLDDDDLLYPYTVKRQLEELENHPDYGMVYSDAMVIDEEGNELGLRANGLLPSGDIYKEVTSGRLLCLMGTIMVRRECIDDVGMFDPELMRYEDLDFVRRISEKFKIKFINVPLLKYRKHQKAMTVNKYNVTYFRKRYENIFNSERFNNMSEDFRSDIFSKYCHHLGKSYYYLSDYKMARKYLLKSIYYSPKRLKKHKIYKHLLETILGKNISGMIKNIFIKIKSSLEKLPNSF